MQQQACSAIERAPRIATQLDTWRIGERQVGLASPNSGRITRDSDRTLTPEEEHESPEEVRSQRKRCLQIVDE